jgi:hypothetical protein
LFALLLCGQAIAQGVQPAKIRVNGVELHYIEQTQDRYTEEHGFKRHPFPRLLNSPIPKFRTLSAHKIKAAISDCL